jgi:hypothetical protein
MQVRTVTIALTLAALGAFTPVTSAARCTDAQRRIIESLEADSVVSPACLQSDAAVASLDRIDPKVWARASPCRSITCVKFLKDQVSNAPNCTANGVNMRSLFAAKLDLCVDLASGKLSADQIKQRISNVTDHSV